MMFSAAGERQIFPKHTNSSLKGVESGMGAIPIENTENTPGVYPPGELVQPMGSAAIKTND
jgi:hypothetical protein